MAPAGGAERRNTPAVGNSGGVTAAAAAKDEKRKKKSNNRLPGKTAAAPEYGAIPMSPDMARIALPNGGENQWQSTESLDAKRM